MENASKALIMAGSILIGVMILSLGVYLFKSYASTSQQINKQMTDTQITEFNSQFTKYEDQKKVRAYNIVSIANLARQNNEQYYGENYNASTEKGEPYYITVMVNGINNGKINGINTSDFSSNNFENQAKSSNSLSLQDFIKAYSLKEDKLTPYYFECKSVNINSNTKLVNKIVFALLEN